MRQWKALMKKNFINWKRKPFCSAMELICPALVVALLCYLKTVTNSAKVTKDETQAISSPIYPGLLFGDNNFDPSDFSNG